MRTGYSPDIDVEGPPPPPMSSPSHDHPLPPPRVEEVSDGVHAYLQPDGSGPRSSAARARASRSSPTACRATSAPGHRTSSGAARSAGPRRTTGSRGFFGSSRGPRGAPGRRGPVETAGRRTSASGAACLTPSGQPVPRLRRARRTAARRADRPGRRRARRDHLQRRPAAVVPGLIATGGPSIPGYDPGCTRSLPGGRSWVSGSASSSSRSAPS
ncbi:hypothetical protein E1286_00975 [Nonomuraea terrae]|uniref:Uncharacterized protein n=1 Tax=Nonomuraea terrae TaxID=2530383 RepID=A0A4R4ZFU5_9ACTN|nr:hypothetical protein E1286_00975 [Nonomuraea terrae]